MTLEQFFHDNEDWRKYADLVALPPTPDELRSEFPDADRDVLALCERGFPSVGALYVRIRREGSEDRFAAMLALQSPPRGETSDSFWAGRKHFSEVFGEEYANKVKKQLAKQGVNLKPGDEYMPELAERPYDPAAVVPFDGARSYIKGLCQKRGWACEGAVNVSHREPETDPHHQTPLGDDLIRANAKRMIAKDPSLKRLDRRQLREAVLEKHGPSK